MTRSRRRRGKREGGGLGKGEKEGDKSVLLPFPNVTPGNRGCERASLPTSDSIDCVRRAGFAQAPGRARIHGSPFSQQRKQSRRRRFGTAPSDLTLELYHRHHRSLGPEHPSESSTWLWHLGRSECIRKGVFTS